MKAIVYRKYGSSDVLELHDVDKPAVGSRDVLVRVHAASVNRADWHLLTGTPPVVRLYWGLFRPGRKVLGHDAAGTVEAVGEGVTRFRPGDSVFGTSEKAGAFAESMRVSEDGLVRKPERLSDEEAAASPTAALAALQGLRDKGRIEPGQWVLINGASGGVGTFAVQIAKAFEAEVTGVCGPRNVEMVRSLGADRVIDYTQDDFTKRDDRYDVILDLVGNHSMRDLKRVLCPKGTYVAAAGGAARMLWIALTGGKRMVSLMSQPTQEDLQYIKDLLEAGVVRPVIDRSYALEEVPEAIRYVGEGHARGKVVITM